MNCPESNQKLWQTGETRTAKRSMQGQNGDGPSSPLQAEPRALGIPSQGEKENRNLPDSADIDFPNLDDLTRTGPATG